MFDENCIFCKIVQGTIPCARVYEDELFLAFLDIAPVLPGHALVIPRQHHQSLLDLPPELAAAYPAVLQKVGRAAMTATGAGGLNVLMNCLRPAGQLVDHAHAHLIPRFADDGLRFWPQSAYASAQEMNALAEKIRVALT